MNIVKITKSLFFGALCCLSTQTMAEAEGVITVASQHSVSDTLDKLEAMLKDKGMNIFARVDHSGGAQKVGKTLAPTELLIFGNPKIGTPLMQCQRSVAIDLPQKMLAWQDENGKVWLSYNDPLYLAQRHQIDMENPCYPILEKVSKALGNFAAQSAK